MQVSLLASLGNFNVASTSPLKCKLSHLLSLSTSIVINPAYGELAAEFGISTVTASYQTWDILLFMALEELTMKIRVFIQHCRNSHEWLRTVPLLTSGKCLGSETSLSFHDIHRIRFRAWVRICKDLSAIDWSKDCEWDFPRGVSVIALRPRPRLILCCLGVSMSLGVASVSFYHDIHSRPPVVNYIISRLSRSTTCSSYTSEGVRWASTPCG